MNIDNEPWKTDYIEAQQTGVWFPRIEPGMFVKKGGLIGTVKDFFGNGKSSCDSFSNSNISF